MIFQLFLFESDLSARLQVTVVIINWNFRGPRTHRMPNWIRVVFLK